MWLPTSGYGALEESPFFHANEGYEPQHGINVLDFQKWRIFFEGIFKEMANKKEKLKTLLTQFVEIHWRSWYNFHWRLRSAAPKGLSHALFLCSDQRKIERLSQKIMLLWSVPKHSKTAIMLLWSDVTTRFMKISFSQLSPQLKMYKAFKTFKLSQYYKEQQHMIVYQVACCQQQLPLTRKCPQALFVLLPRSTCQSCAGSLLQKLAIVSFSLLRCEFSQGTCLRLSGSSFSVRELSELVHCQVTGCGLSTMEEWLLKLEVTDKWICKGSVANWQLQNQTVPSKEWQYFQQKH